MRDLTLDEVVSFGPCEGYPREKILNITGGRTEMPWQEWLSLGAPLGDKVWLGIQLLTDREKHLFACRTAERALTRVREVGRDLDPRSWDAIVIKRRWVDGKATDETLKAARYAARDVTITIQDAAKLAKGDAYAPTWTAAWAARAAGAATAVAACWCATEVAWIGSKVAWYAATINVHSHTWAPARDAEHQEQLDDIVATLEDL